MKSQRQGRNLALLGAGVQIVITIAVLVLWRITESVSLGASIWLHLGGLGLWLITALLFYARQLQRREAMELEELAEQGEQGTIFDEESDAELRPAARQLRFIEKWIINGVTLGLTVYHILLGWMVFRALPSEAAESLASTGAAAVFLVILGFAAFLFSRYSTGMSRASDFRPLRAPGAYLLLGALMLAASFVAMLFASQRNVSVDFYIAWVIPALQWILAIELLLNLVLDIYRPRLPGEDYRPSYESRLLNLFAEPGRVTHSIADTLNYQFGFEVSRTWFYQLISRAILPLLIFAVVVMFAMTSIVVVNDGERAYVKHWGQLDPDAPTLGPGIHLKWFWPVATAERYPIDSIHEMFLGVGGQTEATQTKSGNEMILWAQEHGINAQLERDFLIGVPPYRLEGSAREGQQAGSLPSVSIIKLVVMLRYRIAPEGLYDYAYRYVDSENLIRSIAHQEMVRYVATATLDEPIPGEPDRPAGIMTFGREAAAEALKERIATRLQEEEMGVELTYVGIVSAHPPADAVPSYERVLEAERLQDKQRYQAEAEASRILAEVSGDPSVAMRFALALQREETFEQLVRMRGRTEELQDTAKRIASQVQDQIRRMDREIQREQLLGKTASTLENRIRLREAYEDFHDMLLALMESPESFDFDMRIRQAREDVNGLLDRLEGQPAKMIADAEAYRWQKELGEQVAVEEYQRKMMPYQAAPRVYMYDQYMDVLEQVLPNRLKYVSGLDPDRTQIRMHLEQKRDASEIMTLPGAEGQ